MKKCLLFIGVDISKKWIDVSLTCNGDRKGMVHHRFGNSETGFKKAIKWIKEQSKVAPEFWLFCMEHTGVYTIPLCHYLSNHSLAYVLESALQIQRSLGIKRGKNDKADSKDIARYAYLHRQELKLTQLPSEALLELKALFSLRKRLVKTRMSLAQPAQELKEFGRHDFVQDIYENTQQLVDQLRSRVKKIEQRMKQVLQEQAQLKKLFDLVCSVKGIGLINAVAMIIHTNAFTAFETAKQFACYIGVAPFEHCSGTSVHKPARVSPMANKKLKAYITQAAQCAILYDKDLKAYYQRRLEEGKNKYSVLNAVKNKLVLRVFAVVKRGTPYVEIRNFA